MIPADIAEVALACVDGVGRFVNMLVAGVVTNLDREVISTSVPI